MVSPAKKFAPEHSGSDAVSAGASPGESPLHALPGASKSATAPQPKLTTPILLFGTAIVAGTATLGITHYTGLSWAWSYFAAINGALFLLSGYDRSVKGSPAWSVPEPALLGAALLGGSVGLLVSMWLFRHKTSAPKFQIALVLIVVAQLAALRYLFPEFLHSINPSVRRAP